MTPLFDKWSKLPSQARARVEARLGPLEPASPFELPQAEFTTYAAQDASVTYGVASKLLPRIRSMGLDEVAEMDMDIIPMVYAMMERGMLVSIPHFEALSEALDSMMADGHTKINIWLSSHNLPSPGNIGSDDQIAELLFSTLKLPYLYLTESGKRPSVDKETLEVLKYSHPVAGLVLDWRELETLKTSFTLPLLAKVKATDDGRIHPTILLTRQPTGRLTTKQPNLLATPVMTPMGKLIREGFIPASGYSFLSVDMSQLEARVLAHLSKDAHLCEIFNKGGDVFRNMASEWYGVKPEDISDEVRYVTKHNFYGIQNGLTAQGLSIRLRGEGLPKWTVDRVQEFMDGFFATFPGVTQAISTWHAEARATGMVRDMWGRYRYLPQVRSTKKAVREAGLRAAQNFNMPGGAAGIMKLAMKEVWDSIDWTAGYIYPNLQIHDELLFEVEQGLEEWSGKAIAGNMEQAIQLRVPLKAKWAYSPESWGAIPK